ncbi:imelysin family protein [Phaeobacter gallaeciensis]|uniref:imelysin family protein n=1 Tax=Phaeobacter gallaeciensis TaxID=60890 RepID=UPI000BBC0F31|nr:imelysin family protein [Phaeobacter gallaeciensis]ATF19122.1 putative periplasmic lipoprotein [Phaeobacter gallaeciensis]ATF23231.1 putative periplasmic lipoprotein [Phaeobacter gallaeciensis]
MPNSVSLSRLRLAPAVALTVATALVCATLPPQAALAQTETTAVTAPNTPPQTLAKAHQLDWILTNHILPGFDRLAQSSATLAEVAASHCTPDDPALRDAFARAFDAWISVSHLRFGPTETDNRAFALAFWPDSRNKIPGTLRRALTEATRDSLTDADSFASQSVALRGFYALEYLLFDAAIQSEGTADQRCALVAAISADIARTTAAIRDDWHNSYAVTLVTPGPGNRYQSEAEIRQELFKTLTTGFQVLVDMRLGRPLGQFDAPRPKRAEARRSARSQHHIVLSLTAMEPLALALAAGDPALVQDIHAGFAKALKRASALDDPSLAGVADPARRFRIEAVQQDINDLRSLITTRLGPKLGVTAGFNSLDGD